LNSFKNQGFRGFLREIPLWGRIHSHVEKMTLSGKASKFETLFLDLRIKATNVLVV